MQNTRISSLCFQDAHKNSNVTFLLTSITHHKFNEWFPVHCVNRASTDLDRVTKAEMDSPKNIDTLFYCSNQKSWFSIIFIEVTLFLQILHTDTRQRIQNTNCDGKGINLDGTYLNHLHFEDIVIISGCEMELEQMLATME